MRRPRSRSSTSPTARCASSPASGASTSARRWASDGSLLFVSDADGWFQVVRLTADGHDRIVLTAGEREHGEPYGGVGSDRAAALAGRQPVRPRRGPRRAAGPRRRRDGRRRGPEARSGPAAEDAADRVRRDGRQPHQPVGRRLAVGRLDTGRGLGRGDRRARDLAPGPVAAPRPGRRARRRPPAPGHRLAAGRPPRRPLAVAHPEGGADRRSPRATASASRARSGARTRRPASAAGRAPRSSSTRTAARPAQAFRSFQPFKQVLVAAGFAVLDVDFRGSTGYGRAFRMANHDEWGHADVHDVIDAARWAADQPWADGRLAIYGGSYGGYMVLCALVEEPSMWRAGVDLYGDSEIAESYRHGDRLGRLDLHKMMGSPDDAARAEVYRRGSPVYRAERIEAPVLLIHGRKDKRVVPLMTERMVEALEIEGKRHEVHWYDEEGHGWERARTGATRSSASSPSSRRTSSTSRPTRRSRPRAIAGIVGSFVHRAVVELGGDDDRDRAVVPRRTSSRASVPVLGRQPGAGGQTGRLRLVDLAGDRVATGRLERGLVEPVGDVLVGAFRGPDARAAGRRAASAASQSYRISSAPSRSASAIAARRVAAKRSSSAVTLMTLGVAPLWGRSHPWPPEDDAERLTLAPVGRAGRLQVRCRCGRVAGGDAPGPHRERDRGRDADPDQHVADAEHVRERQPGGQREDVGQGAAARGRRR